MAVPKVYVDGLLVTWSDTLFSPPYRPAKMRTPKGSSGWMLLPLALAAGSARAQVTRTARKVPEVMVKITNKMGAGRGMANIRNHIDYISRNGKLEIEDQNGDLIHGRSELDALKDHLQISGGRLIPDEEGKVRHTLNVVFSMAPGTPADKVKAAVREFAQTEFDGREYIFVLHTDTLHPHVHVCVKTARTPELKRLRPGRDDLQRWREGFAQMLRNNGIEANATARRTRGVVKQPFRQVEIHRARRHGTPLVPRAVDLSKTPQFAHREREAWKAITKALNSSESPGDVHLAKEVLNFWKQTPFADYAGKTMTERKDRERQHFERGWRLAATRLHQSDSSQTRAGGQPQAHSISNLRPLPSWAMASEQGKGTPLLLYPNAPDYLGWRSTADSGMRRPDSRGTGAPAGAVVQMTQSSALTAPPPSEVTHKPNPPTPNPPVKDRKR